MSPGFLATKSQVEITYACGCCGVNPKPGRMCVGWPHTFFRTENSPWYKTKKPPHIIREWSEICNSIEELAEAVEGDIFG